MSTACPAPYWRPRWAHTAGSNERDSARDKLGKFGSADELRDYAELPPGRIDELCDLMIFS
jgi:hypothetical protein